MQSKINKIMEEIDKKTQELKLEYMNLMSKYNFSFENGRIKFTKDKTDSDRRKKEPFWDSILWITFRELLSIPFIYSMFFPVVFFDIFLFIYQQTAIRLYWIPLVKRSDYITYDRKELQYLNWIQKFNCLYCAYVNWFLSYAVEVAWRTEKYWCPIKHAKKMNWWHEWQKYFADYGDVEWFKETFHNKDIILELYSKDKQTKEEI